MQTQRYYDRYWSANGFFQRRIRLHPSASRVLEKHVAPGWSCLDLGSGDGRSVGLWALRRGCAYVGVDVSENAASGAQRQGLDVRAVRDIGELPFPDESFDAVVCFEVLEHLFEPQRATAEALRLLKPGGPFIVTVPNVAYWKRRVEMALFGRWNPLGDDLSVEQPWRDPHIRFFNRGALARLLLSSGFRSVDVGGFGGGIARELPWLGRRLTAEGGTAYRALARGIPALFAERLFGVAHKPNPAP